MKRTMAATRPEELTCVLEPVEPLNQLENLWRQMDVRGEYSFFLTWPWIGTWLRTLPSTSHLQIIKALRGPELVGLAISSIREGRIWGVVPIRQAFFNCVGDRAFDCITIEHNGFASILKNSDELWRAFFRAFDMRTHGVDEIVFPSARAHVDGEARRAGLLYEQRTTPAFRTSLTEVAAAGGIQNLLSRNARQQLRRSLREFERMGPIVVDAAGDREMALAYFTALKELHIASWTRRGKPHAFRYLFFEAFHRELIDGGFDAGAVELLRVAAGPHVLGYLYNFKCRDNVFAYQSGFGDFDARLRPGYVCHALAIDRHAEAGDLSYDFLAGRNRLKETFATAAYAMKWQRIRRPTPFLRGEALVRSAARGIASRLSGGLGDSDHS